MLSSSVVPATTTVNAEGTTITRQYEVDDFSAWQGSAMIVVYGTGLSTDSADQDYSITSIDFMF